MNKNDLIQKLSDTTGLAKNDAAKAVDGVFDLIAASLKAGDEVRLTGFGVFVVALTVYSIVVNISEIGVSAALVREIDRADEIAPTVTACSAWAVSHAASCGTAGFGTDSRQIDPFELARTRPAASRTWTTNCPVTGTFVWAGPGAVNPWPLAAPDG